MEALRLAFDPHLQNGSMRDALGDLQRFSRREPEGRRRILERCRPEAGDTPVTSHSPTDGPRPPHVVMMAAECRDLAKVGGLGDVMRELPKALVALGVPTTLVLPYYDCVRAEAVAEARFDVPFGGRYVEVEAFRRSLDGVEVFLLRNREYFGGPYGTVYVDSEALGHGPFEDDARRFAFFSAATVEFLDRLRGRRPVDVLHCHDWHAGCLFLLLAHCDRYRELAGGLRTLFTIHNLDYQGQRPFICRGERPELALADWFPQLNPPAEALELIRDPRAPDCFNPMLTAIQLADQVTTVSPTYAREITRPDDDSRGFLGGRGLEAYLGRRAENGALHGILNGLDYELNSPTRLDPAFDGTEPDWAARRARHKHDLLGEVQEVLSRIAADPRAGLANRLEVQASLRDYRAEDWRARPLVVAVTRAAAQKVKILGEPFAGARSLIAEILSRDIGLLILGTGEMEAALEPVNEHANGLFIAAFDRHLADRLYAAGDLFLMPSDFEPCGISQMIAMRFGCLPLVHDVGGLHDTVRDLETGFVYSGATRQATRAALIAKLDQALALYSRRADAWREIQARAMRRRFEWRDSAREMLTLYTRRSP